MKNRIIAVTVALIAVFLLGFVPQYLRANRLTEELRRARQESAGSDLRDLIGVAYVRANQKNYGLAADTASRFFNRTREIANQTQEPSRQKALEDILALRDKVTSELAKGDAAAMPDLQELFMKTQQATLRPAER